MGGWGKSAVIVSFHCLHWIQGHLLDPEAFGATVANRKKSPLVGSESDFTERVTKLSVTYETKP